MKSLAVIVPVIVLVGAVCATDASAQQQLGYRGVLGPVRDAGVYHVATGAWNRGESTASIGPDVIYRNDAPSGYFAVGFDDCWAVDEIMLPGTTSPFGGAADSYLVDGFQFGYCKNGAGTIDWTFGFYESYLPCDDPTSPSNCTLVASGSIALTGMPGGSACWTVTIDLSGGYEVCIDADGGKCTPGYQGSGQWLDHAGIGFAYSPSDDEFAGPLLSGNPDWYPVGEGTCYDPNFTNGCALGVASGLGLQDLFSLSDEHGFPCALSSGCYFFGTGCWDPNGCLAGVSGPCGQFHWLMYTDCTGVAGCPHPDALVYCDETQNPNNAADIDVDTLDSTTTTITVSLENGPANQSCVLCVGDGMGVVSQPPGSVGDLCVAGGSCLGRYGQDVGAISGAGIFFTDVKSPLSNPCNGAVQIVPGATWNFQYWHRQPMGQPSTFSSAMSVTFR